MLRYLLDTSTISWAVARRPSRSVVERLMARGNACAVAAPAWHELVYGCERLPAGRRRSELTAFVEGVVRGLPVLPYDEAAAAWHGRERARLDRTGHGAPFVDGQIAAITHVNGLCLVTANVRDFAHFRDLRIEDWTRARL
jgi:tRNA(fMet)-specific endonuclease VapC